MCTYDMFSTNDLIVSKPKSVRRGSMVEVKCKSCKQPFMARTADVKRGWGKFCSKSCKAKEQEQRTGQYRNYINRPARIRSCYDDDDFDPSWDSHCCYVEPSEYDY